MSATTSSQVPMRRRMPPFRASDSKASLSTMLPMKPPMPRARMLSRSPRKAPIRRRRLTAAPPRRATLPVARSNTPRSAA